MPSGRLLECSAVTARPNRKRMSALRLILAAHLNINVEFHYSTIDDVDRKHAEGFPPFDLLVNEEIDQHAQGDHINRHISEMFILIENFNCVGR